MPDKIKIEILPSGDIKIDTDKISMPSHLNAERFLADVGRLAGGTVTKKHKHGFVEHTHTHSHEQHERA